MNLEEKIKLSQKILKKTFVKWPKEKVAICFTGGKDSTVLLSLTREYFAGQIPCPVLFIEESHFPEVYEFVGKLKKDWNFNLIVAKDEKSLAEYKKTNDLERKKELACLLKINAIKKALAEHRFSALIVGIRWDEHPARAKESYFSLRPDHTRVHPILHFSEQDIWDYIKKFNVPYCSLYNKGFRSLGEKEFTQPVKDKTLPERAGRHQDKEKIMDKLRSLGYF